MDDKLSLLGINTVYPKEYAPEVLETFVNKHPENDYFVKFNCPEFTSLCPITDNLILHQYILAIYLLKKC